MLQKNTKRLLSYIIEHFSRLLFPPVISSSLPYCLRYSSIASRYEAGGHLMYNTGKRDINNNKGTRQARG